MCGGEIGDFDRSHVYTRRAHGPRRAFVRWANACTAVCAARSRGGAFPKGLPPCGNGMDRLDAMKVFVVAVDEGSLAAAGRKLGRSPAAVSRAIAFLEEHTGSKLLYRTTRSIKLSEEGDRY